jgi:dihydrofolate synthase/folylpolyglutamate synthase
VPTVSGVRDPEAREVIAAIASERHSPLLELDRDFEFRYTPPAPQWAGEIDPSALRGHVDYQASGMRLEGLEIGLLGRHQAANAAVALAVVEALNSQGWKISGQACRTGLANIHWPARVEFAADRPAVVIDAAHNVAAVEALQSTLAECVRAPHRQLIFATTLEKDVAGMLEKLLPSYDRVFFTRYANNPRGVPVEDLAAIAAKLGADHCTSWATLAEAWQAAKASAGPESLICVTGSFFVAAEMRELLRATGC